MTTPTTSQHGGRLLEAADSPLLRIPPELRLSIYEFALFGGACVTIGSAEVVGKHHDVIHHLHAHTRRPYPGIPLNHAPVISRTYDSSLLSTTHPATIPATSSPTNPTHNYSAHQSLLLTNRQIKEELTSHFKLPKARQTSIFTSYPYGLHILKTSAPQLLSQAQSIHLAGRYTSTSFNPARAARESPPAVGGAPQRHNGDLTPDFPSLLGQLVASTFGPNPLYRVRKLEMRIYYPGDDSYSAVWGDDDSPTVVALRNISNAEVGIEVWRGTNGTGIYLTARPARERKRIVSTVWRKLEEGRREQAEPGTWVVDPKWPRWEAEYDMSEGPQGNVFTSAPVEHATGGASAS